jgi:hypothetical protein
MKNLTAKNAVIKLNTFPIAISERLDVLRVSQFLSILYAAAAESVGIARKNENSVAAVFDNFLPNAPAIVDAERLVPGIIANDCIIPIINASRYDMVSTVLSPGLSILSINTRKIPTDINEKATIIGVCNMDSKTSSNNNPKIAAGINPITSFV